jgi:hypothetical protein
MPGILAWLRISVCAALPRGSLDCFLRRNFRDCFSLFILRAGFMHLPLSRKRPRPTTKSDCTLIVLRFSLVVPAGYCAGPPLKWHAGWTSCYTPAVSIYDITLLRLPKPPYPRRG